MKKIIKYFLPLPCALFSFLFYIVLYNPVIPSGDFIAAILVFWAALGAAAVVLFSREKRHGIMYLYASVAVIFSLFTLPVFKKSCAPLHLVLAGLIFLGLAVLRLFVSAYLKQEEKK